MGELKKLVEEGNLALELLLTVLSDEDFFHQGPKLLESISKDDVRQHHPRFRPENMEHNKLLFERVNEIATKEGMHPITACAGLGSSPGR
ncbi:hypothetical protein Patl1_24193 [Pistacia atlantica]|uniref:Uncharacterized protein n=1 Tax=Pistacia atlantica TaxID=434234 RepID=A0ACC1A1I6_9ROSI|nr:hypothetical protein Patl1_24193 [Pistacia atlantica]